MGLNYLFTFYRPEVMQEPQVLYTSKKTFRYDFTMKPYTIKIFDILPQEINVVLSAKCLITKHVTSHNMENCFMVQPCIKVQ